MQLEEIKNTALNRKQITKVINSKNLDFYLALIETQILTVNDLKLVINRTININKNKLSSKQIEVLKMVINRFRLCNRLARKIVKTTNKELEELIFKNNQFKIHPITNERLIVKKKVKKKPILKVKPIKRV